MAFGFAVVMNFVSYWFSDKIVLKMYRAQEVGPDHRLSIMTRRLATQAQSADAEGLRHSRRVAERVRDGPQSEPRGGRGDRRHHAAAGRSGARRRHRARAGAREAPRHSHQLGCRDRRGGHHDDGAHGAVRRDVRRRAAAATSARARTRLRCSRRSSSRRSRRCWFRRRSRGRASSWPTRAARRSRAALTG